MTQTATFQVLRGRDPYRTSRLTSPYRNHVERKTKVTEFPEVGPEVERDRIHKKTFRTGSETGTVDLGRIPTREVGVEYVRTQEGWVLVRTGLVWSSGPSVLSSKELCS